VLADGIQDDAGNVTRFVMLAREPIIPRTDRLFRREGRWGERRKKRKRKRKKRGEGDMWGPRGPTIFY
jgi:prephenate dehydratase